MSGVQTHEWEGAMVRRERATYHIAEEEGGVMVLVLHPLVRNDGGVDPLHIVPFYFHSTPHLLPLLSLY